MRDDKPSFTWWKIIVGSVLVYINSEQLMFPETRALQPSNEGEARVMITVEIIILLIGAWLAFSGIWEVLRRSRSAR